MGKIVGGVETIQDHFATMTNMPNDLAEYDLDITLQRFYEGGLHKQDVDMNNKVCNIFKKYIYYLNIISRYLLCCCKPLL